MKREKHQIQTLLLLFVIGGVFGFIYEELFYWIDLGYLVKRGTTYGPWIPIYGFGAVIIILAKSRFKDKPWIVFLVSALVSGVIEYLTGYVLLHIFHLRLWDYTTEIWNWCNIGGFVCLRSVIFFGISAFFFQYLIMPLLTKFTEKFSMKQISLIAGIPAALFAGDIIVSLLGGALK